MSRSASRRPVLSRVPAPLREAWRLKERLSTLKDAVHVTLLIVGGTIACFVDGHVWLGSGILVIVGICALLIRLARRTPAGEGLQRQLPAYLALPLACLFALALMVGIIAATAS